MRTYSVRLRAAGHSNVLGIKMAQHYARELDSAFALVVNFQGDPEVTITTLNTCGQCLRLSHLLAGRGDTEGMKFADTGQLCFEYK